jgi:hypothetical protein
MVDWAERFIFVDGRIFAATFGIHGEPPFLDTLLLGEEFADTP